MDKSLRSFVAELVGTFLFVFFGAGAICVSDLPLAAEEPRLLTSLIALAQGMLLLVALAATLHVSGGFLNPAVVPVLYIFKRIDLGRAVGYVAVQVLGAVLAGLFLHLLFTDEVFRAGVPHLNLAAFGANPVASRLLLTGAGVEFALTFLLTFAIFGTVLDPRAPRMAGLGVGLALAVGTFFGFPLTGASANPARWLGLAIWGGPRAAGSVWDDVSIYVIAPAAGALLAGVVYGFLILPPRSERSGAV
jgi:aquaporin TIP